MEHQPYYCQNLNTSDGNYEVLNHSNTNTSVKEQKVNYPKFSELGAKNYTNESIATPNITQNDNNQVVVDINNHNLGVNREVPVLQEPKCSIDFRKCQFTLSNRCFRILFFGGILAYVAYYIFIFTL